MSAVVISSEFVLGPPEWLPADARPMVTIIEFDVPICQLVYGEAPCTAALGVTGSRRCYNTRSTCQDLANFTPELVTYRFTRPSERIYRDGGRDVIPSVTGVRTTPQLLDPGVNLGQRESVTVTFEDHPHSDAGFDPYLEDRGFDPFERGTFWGKFRARFASLRGLPLRVYRGQLGQTLQDMQTWHYVIETASMTGDSYTIIAKDHLKLLDDDRAQAPAVSRGSLADPISDSDGSLTLAPAGIGDIDYDEEGLVAIGGREIASYTRTLSSDVLMLTGRGLYGTEAQAHDEGDRVQVVLEYVSQPVEAIIFDLLTQYTEIDPAWITYADWQAEVGSVVNQLYTARIPEPTGVNELVIELIEQVGLVPWWDAQAMQVRLTALRPVAADARVLGGDILREDSFRAVEQPKKRVSEVWTYFNLRNPLERMDDPANYTSVAVSADFTADPAEPPAIRKVFSRWIGFGNRGAALRVNGLLLSRYAQPPRLFSFELFHGTDMPLLGRGARVAHRSLQDDEGSPIARPVQIVSVEPDSDVTRFQAEEMLFQPNPELGDLRVIVLDVDSFNVNIRTLHDQFYLPPEAYDEVLVIVESGVTVGSQNAFVPALDLGPWPPLVSIRVLVRGRIQGAGGGGASVDLSMPQPNGFPGGVALFTRVPITVDSVGEIFGGGGGGASDVLGPSWSGGGGGAGTLPGPGGFSLVFIPGQGVTSVQAPSGTRDAGGVPPAPAGAGGNPGQPGGNATIGSGGAAGAAVDGESFVSYDAEGSILGPRIN